MSEVNQEFEFDAEQMREPEEWAAAMEITVEDQNPFSVWKPTPM